MSLTEQAWQSIVATERELRTALSACQERLDRQCQITRDWQAKAEAAEALLVVLAWGDSV